MLKGYNERMRDRIGTESVNSVEQMPAPKFKIEAFEGMLGKPFADVMAKALEMNAAGREEMMWVLNRRWSKRPEVTQFIDGNAYYFFGFRRNNPLTTPALYSDYAGENYQYTCNGKYAPFSAMNLDLIGDAEGRMESYGFWASDDRVVLVDR